MPYRVTDEDHPIVYLNDANVYAIDRENGKIAWRYDAKNRVVRMLLAYDCVYVLDVECVVHCIRAVDGTVLGKVRVGNAGSSGAAMLADEDEGYVYVATTEGVSCLAPDGKKRWSFASPTPGTNTVLPGLGLPHQMCQPDFRD